MREYKVLKNQNIFDIALSVHGSVEGIFDLLVSNSHLSFDTQLKENDVLVWDEEFVIHSSVVDSLKEENLIPANGERRVYYKETNEVLRCYIIVSPDDTDIQLSIAGDGDILIDWGDNSDLETITLQPTIRSCTHYFDNLTDKRVLRLYGDFRLKTWDLSGIKGRVLPTMPLLVDEVLAKKNNLSPEGLFLFDGTYSVILSDMAISSLTALQTMNLSFLQLTKIDYGADTVLDDYLIYVASHYNERRNCKVVMDKRPSGDYQEPARDSQGNYLINTGMEAMYVITHEPAWNESGPWIFDVNGTIYSGDNIKLNYTLPLIL